MSGEHLVCSWHVGNILELRHVLAHACWQVGVLEQRDGCHLVVVVSHGLTLGHLLGLGDASCALHGLWGDLDVWVFKLWWSVEERVGFKFVLLLTSLILGKWFLVKELVILASHVHEWVALGCWVLWGLLSLSSCPCECEASLLLNLIDLVAMGSCHVLWEHVEGPIFVPAELVVCGRLIVDVIDCSHDRCVLKHGRLERGGK